MKVLHVIPSVSPVYGGPSYAIRGMTAALARAGLKVDVATTDANGEKALDVSFFKPQLEDGVRHFYFPRQSPKRWTFSLPMARWLYQHTADYDLLHIHALFSFPTLPACDAAHRMKVLYILRPIGTLGKWSLGYKSWQKFLYYHFIEKRNLERAAAVQATSSLEARDLARLGFGEKTRTIPLGVDFAAKPLTLQRNGAHPRLLFLSRLHPVKALPILFQSLVLLKKEGLEPQLVIVGDGADSYRLELKNRIKELGIKSQVEFRGYLEGEEKVKVFSSSEIFVLPSYQESFGLAVAEAMAAGLPVVVTEQVGIAPEIQEYGAGIVVKNSPDSLKEGLLKLLQDPMLRFRMGEAGRRLVSEKFSWEIVARQLVQLYEGILAGKN